MLRLFTVSLCHISSSCLWRLICDLELDHLQCPQCFVTVVIPFSIGQTARRRVYHPAVVLICPSRERDSSPEMYQIGKAIPQCNGTQLKWGLKPLAFLWASFSNLCLLHLIYLNNINRAVWVYGKILSHLKSLEQWCFWNDVTLRMQIPLNCAFAKKAEKKKNRKKFKMDLWAQGIKKVSRDWGPDKTAQWKCWRGGE